MHPLDEFKRDIAGYPPGLLVLFDIVDAKRRNSHLGHAVVDSEIDELDRRIRSSVGASGVAKRVGEDEWALKTRSFSALCLLSRVCFARYRRLDRQVAGTKL